MQEQVEYVELKDAEYICKFQGSSKEIVFEKIIDTFFSSISWFHLTSKKELLKSTLEITLFSDANNNLNNELIEKLEKLSLH